MTSVEEPPLNYKNNIQLTNNFCHLTCSVSVEYCIYDPKKKKILKKGSSRPCGINCRSISIHAEDDAISYCRNKDIPLRCSIYIWRWKKDGKIKPYKSCNACTKIINKYNFNNRVFTFNGDIIESALVDNPSISLGYKMKHGL